MAETNWCPLRRTAAACSILQLMVTFASWFGVLFFIMEYDYRKVCWLGTAFGGIFGIVAMATFLTWMGKYNKDQGYDSKYKMGGGMGIMIASWLCNFVALVPMKQCGILGTPSAGSSITRKTTTSLITTKKSSNSNASSI